jgi:general secretion pathway protein A
MYTEYFRLKQEPFSIAPDPRFLFMSGRHREALAHLLYGLGGGGGFVLLSGEIGAGKTTVCRCFLEQVPRRCNVAYIFNPKLTVIELLSTVCEEFHIPMEQLAGRTASVKDYVDLLNDFLLRTHAVGQNNVLVIDEAQNLSPDVLEQLRLLTNLETDERKLLQIILIGQPELRAMLARPELEQLEQRVIARFHLDALSATETAHYIRHRMAVAGATGVLPFDREARQRIHELARGIPRRINLLCDRALLGAYAGHLQRVNRATVEQAAREVFDNPVVGVGTPWWRERPRLAWGLGAVAVLALASVSVMVLEGRRNTPANRVASPVPPASAPAASAPAASAAASAANGAASSTAKAVVRATPGAAHGSASAVAPSLRGRATPLEVLVGDARLARGLAPGGVTGPVTVMQLHRTLGADEPRQRALK